LPAQSHQCYFAGIVYVAESSGKPRAADDAANVQIFSMDAFPEELAFDHGLILADYLNYRQTGKLTPLRHSGE